eukprot:2924326-Rhodomonas_salina.3
MSGTDVAYAATSAFGNGISRWIELHAHILAPNTICSEIKSKSSLFSTVKARNVFDFAAISCCNARVAVLIRAIGADIRTSGADTHVFGADIRAFIPKRVCFVLKYAHFMLKDALLVLIYAHLVLIYARLGSRRTYCSPSRREASLPPPPHTLGP